MSYFSEKKDIHIPIKRVRVKRSGFGAYDSYVVQYKTSNSFFSLWQTYGSYTEEEGARREADHIIKSGELVKQEYVTNEMYYEKK